MIAIRGYSSAIAQALVDILPMDEAVENVPRDGCNVTADRHLFCQGVLYGKPSTEYLEYEIAECFRANYITVKRQCDLIFAANPTARVCVIGSESAFAGSYDDLYAGSKMLLHHYVTTKKLGPEQQLICIAPSIVGDAGMTTRREDTDNLVSRETSHPKGRFLTCDEVAADIFHYLYVHAGYGTGVVIRLNGGQHNK